MTTAIEPVIGGEPLVVRVESSPALSIDAVTSWTNRHAVPAAAVGMACLGFVVAAAAIWTNAVDPATEPVLVALLIAELFLGAHVYYWQREIDAPLVVLVGLTLVGSAVNGALPEYFSGAGQSAIFHRTVVAALVLVAVALPLACIATFHLLGATPVADDVAHYPLLVVPTLLVLGVYAVMLGVLVVQGVPQLSWTIITHQLEPARTAARIEPGFANHILGTLLLIVLTSVISVPIGAGTGIFLQEYASARVAAVVRFCTTALRGVSVLVIGLMAVTVLQITAGTPVAGILEGSYVDPTGTSRSVGGSFILAAMVISLLVIPVVTRATEEGCRSLPEGLREASAALGATDAYLLRRVILPWAFPNIMTSILLGSAEAAGSLAPLIFIALPGDTGVGLTRPVTSLSYVIFDAFYSLFASFRNAMEPHRFGGAVVLLIIALILTSAGLTLKHRYASRYRS